MSKQHTLINGLIFSLLSIALLISNKLLPNNINIISINISGIFNSSEKKIEQVIINTVDAFSKLSIIGSLSEENKQLKTKLSNYNKLYLENKRLQYENNDLKKITHFSSELTNHHYISSLAVSSDSAFGKGNVLLHSGTSSGVKINNTVISNNGILGRISKVSKNYAVVTTIFNENSRVPIYGLISNAHGIAKGGKQIYIYNSNKNAFIQNEIIITSGKAGVFPRNIALGKVQIKHNKITIDPFVNINKMDYALIITNTGLVIKNAKSELK